MLFLNAYYFFSDKAQEISKQLQNEWLDPKYILGKGSFERAKQDQWKEALKNILTAEGSQKLFYFIDNNRKMSEYLVESMYSQFFTKEQIFFCHIFSYFGIKN